MGYELHIERDDSRPIGSSEWLAVISNDPELEPAPDYGEYFARHVVDGVRETDQGWLAWCDGRISSKYPDNALLAKMLSVAEHLDATVRGDDGEIYTEPDIHAGVEPAVPAPQVGWRERLLDRWHRLFPRRNKVPLPFKVGDRVRDTFGLGTVIAIDRRADHGLGRVAVRYDDGREAQMALVAHGLEKPDAGH